MSSMFYICFWTLLLGTSSSNTIHKLSTASDTELITLHSSCNNLNDGLYYIKPTENGKIIPVICSNSYTMIDPSLNFESITSYLSSYDYSRLSNNIITSDINDFVSFNSWWIPSKNDDKLTQFQIANNCDKCMSSTNFESNSAYYMTNYYFCNINEYQSSTNKYDNNNNICYDDINTETEWSKCSAIILNADLNINTDHNKCAESFRPSMSLTRNVCTCYKPNDESIATYQVKPDELPQVHIDLDSISLDYIDENIIIYSDDDDDTTDDDTTDDSDNDSTLDDAATSNIVYLSSSDIISGTYRITTPGTYILAEDLTFNFNPPTDDMRSNPLWSPNSYDSDLIGWYPSTEQTEEYNSLYSYQGTYSLGFFAGITIECNDVIIDLNGHQIDMDYEFYLQQRFFSLIELSNRQFIPGEGITYNTDDIVYTSNIWIKDGTLGLSSHHGIHGNNVNALTISNVGIQNFDVTGLQCNGCNSVTITDTIVGPQNTNIPVLGRYTHARAFLPRLRELSDNFGSEEVQFANREVTTVQDVIDRMVNQMDMIYNHVIHGTEYDNDDPEWLSASKLFLNPSGLMDGGASYGMIFNGIGSAITEIGADMDGTTDVHLMSTEVQGIYCAPLEKFKLTDNDGNDVRLLFNDALDVIAVMDQIHDLSTTHYIGDSYTDLNFIVDKYINTDWYYLNTLSLNDGLRELVWNDDNTLFSSNFNIYGSTDIQLQSSKGAIGIRVDGVQGFKIEQSSIHNIENWGHIGSTLPGEYSVPSIYSESDDIQYGYTGNRAQGLMFVGVDGYASSIEIYDINSQSGSAHGTIIYESSNIGISLMQTRNIQAGSKTTQNDIELVTLPNIIPIACSVEIRGDSTLYSLSDRDDYGDVTGHFIIGYDLCYDIEDNPDTNGIRVGQCEWCYNKNANIEDNGGLVDGQMVTLQSDCSNLEDGLQYILPDPQIGTVIPVKCDSGYTMLDGSLSPNLKDYFTSYSMSHRDNTLMLPNTDEHTSWRDWFIPADDDTSFRVASTCDSCLDDDNPLTMHDDTAYYSTGDYLCFYIRKIDNLCSYSDVYCNICDDPNAKTYDQPYDDSDPESDSYTLWEQCKYVRASADDVSIDDHYYCTHREPFMWPALSTDGTGCTCYKPSTTEEYTVPLVQAVNQFETANNLFYTELEATSEYLYIELTNDDFLEGTYRITQPGTYKLMEDIIFNFNSPSEDLTSDPTWSPNDFNENGDIWWWPRKDQEDIYPGASKFYDPFTLGYFAGISVETSDVILDLNGFSLEMSYPFYLQQRFFSLIELANRPFAPGKGAANWGWIEHYATNVIVKNGHLGLSSHHCLHGNFLNNVLVTDVSMSSFDVAGFGCGQCIKVTLNNLDIGPQHQSIPVLGRYTHARAFLPRLQYFMENYGDWQVPFWDRSPTVNELGERLLNQMDMVYNYVINGQEYDDDNTEWLEAKKLFINDAGYQDASASYGVVFAGGAAVSAIGTRIMNEGDITATNINIHGLRSHVMEKYKVYGSGTTVTMRGFFRDTIDWEAITDNFDDLDNVKYIGNAYEDLLFATVLNEDISKEWSFLYTTQIEQFVKDWITTGDAETANLERYLDIHCGTDIQVHSVKGAIGFRVDGAENLNVDGITISDIVSTTNLGSMRCGEYSVPAVAGEEPYIQPGFNGHRAHGLTVVYTSGTLKDVSINNIYSNYGSVYGLRVFDGCDITLQGDINVNDLNAGTAFELEEMDMRFMEKSETNPLPQACGVLLYSDQDNINFDPDTTNIDSSNIIGYRDCSETVIRSSDDDFFVSAIVGNCDDNCVIKDMYVLTEDDDDDNELNKSHTTSFPTMSPMTISILVVFIITVIYAIYKYKFNPSQYKDLSSNTDLTTDNKYSIFNFALKASEKTPLLSN